MPGYKKPKMGHKKPKMAHGKKPKMAHGKKPQFNAKLKKAAAEGKLDNNPSFKSAVENAKPKMAHGKKPKMVHGNKPKMYGKPKMYNKKPFMMEPGSKEINSPGSFKANEPAMMFKNNMPKQTKFRDSGGKRSGETLAEYRNRLSGTPDPNFIGRIEANKKMEAAKKEKARIAEITKKRLAKRSGKPNMYGKK